MKIEGKVAFITGGCSGFGYESLKILLQHGAKAGIADLQEDKGKAIIEEFGEDNVIFTKTDVTDPDQVKQAIENTYNKFGALHITLNSAGVFLLSQTYTKTRFLDFKIHRMIMDINVNGTIYSCAYSAKYMAMNEPVNDRGERGVIVNVSSISATYGGRGLVSYSASKGAINGMTLPMARDLGKFGIRVLNIAPSVFLTPMSESMPQEMRESTASYSPLKRIGTPDDFALLFKSCVENGYLNGVSLSINGGAVVPYE